MKKTTLLFLLVVFFVLTGLAQLKTNQLTIGIGYQRTWVLDKQASPLKYQTSEKTFLLNYDHDYGKSLFSMELAGALGDFFPTGYRNRLWITTHYNVDGTQKKDTANLKGSIYNGRIKIGLAKRVNQSNHFKSFAGASVSNELFYTDNITRTGWLNSSAFNAEYIQQARFDAKHFLQVKITIPLFVRNTRLPYHNTISNPNGEGSIKTFFKQGGRWAWLGSFQQVQIAAVYKYAVSKKIDVGFRYDGMWLHYKYEQPLNLIRNNISLTGSIKNF